MLAYTRLCENHFHAAHKIVTCPYLLNPLPVSITCIALSKFYVCTDAVDFMIFTILLDFIGYNPVKAYVHIQTSVDR